jgi:hypothetical protein
MPSSASFVHSVAVDCLEAETTVFSTTAVFFTEQYSSNDFQVYFHSKLHSQLAPEVASAEE